MGGHWFKDLSGHGTKWTERHLTDKECFGTQHRPNKGSQSDIEG